MFTHSSAQVVSFTSAGGGRGGWGFHVGSLLGPWRVWRSGGVSHGVPAGRLGVHMGSWRGGLGFHGGWGFTWGGWGFTWAFVGWLRVSLSLP